MFFVFVLHDFSSVEVICEFGPNLDPLRPKVFGGKKNGGQASVWTKENTCENIEGSSLRNRRRRLDFCAKNM